MRVKIIISTFLLLMAFIASPFMNDAFADQPPDPGTGGPGNGDIPVGGSPIDGGLVILISLGMTYGFRKVYKGKDLAE